MGCLCHHPHNGSTGRGLGGESARHWVATSLLSSMLAWGVPGRPLGLAGNLPSVNGPRSSMRQDRTWGLLGSKGLGEKVTAHSRALPGARAPHPRKTSQPVTFTQLSEADNHRLPLQPTTTSSTLRIPPPTSPPAGHSPSPTAPAA